jgi:cobalt-precorrin 5A hydrolase
VAVFVLTEGGAVVAARVAAVLGATLWLPEALASVHAASRAAGSPSAVRSFVRVGPALREAFGEFAALVCVMASGVVIRSLAPALRGKLEDPAVLCLDEAGRFVIPLLAGHVGGGNALARLLARELGAQAVLTTSSDVQGLLGPDLLALALQAHVTDPGALLAVSAALVNGGVVDLWFDPAEMGRAAPFLAGLGGYRAHSAGNSASAASLGAAAVVVTGRESDRMIGAPTGALHLVPRWVVAGVGCTRGTSGEVLAAAVKAALSEAGVHPAALRALASVRAKQDEPGVFAAAEELKVPLVFASDDDVEAAMAAHALLENPWVRENVGVGGAAEPAALWAAGNGATLILPKRAGGGVTVALARAEGGAMVRTDETRWT